MARSVCGDRPVRDVNTMSTSRRNRTQSERLSQCRFRSMEARRNRVQRFPHTLRIGGHLSREIAFSGRERGVRTQAHETKSALVVSEMRAAERQGRAAWLTGAPRAVDRGPGGGSPLPAFELSRRTRPRASGWIRRSRRSTHSRCLSVPGQLMVALPASTRVNSVRNDDSGLLLADDVLAA